MKISHTVSELSSGHYLCWTVKQTDGQTDRQTTMEKKQYFSPRLGRKIDNLSWRNRKKNITEDRGNIIDFAGLETEFKKDKARAKSNFTRSRNK